MQLAAEEMVWPLDDIWEEYVTPLSREIFDEDGGLARGSVGYNGQMMGLPSITAGIHLTPHFWVRTDWVERLGWADRFGAGILMSVDDYYDYLKAVRDADLNGDGSTVYGTMLSGRMDGLQFWDQLEGLFVGFDAYPVQWVDKDGGLAWGAIQPEMKDALAFVNRLYEDGMVDPEFTAKDDEKAREILASGHCATLFGWHWYPFMGLAENKENDPEADWKVFETPTSTGELARRRLELGIRHVYAVNKNCEYPEAVIKMMNLYNEWNFGPNADYDFWSGPTIDGEFISDIWVLGPVEQLHANIDTEYAEEIQPVFAGERDPSTLTGLAKSYYECCINEWEWWAMFGPDNSAGLQQIRALADPDNLLKYNHFAGPPTPTMVTKWSQLIELTNTFAVQCILGEVDIESAFDEYVNSWNQLGGEQITTEVNEWYDANR